MNDESNRSANMAARLAAETRRGQKEEPRVARAYDNLIARLVESGAGSNAPRVGESFPPFTLPDDEGHLVRLNDLLAEGPVVVSLNRGHWCSYCRIELESLQGTYAEIRRRHASIVAITPDRQAYARKLKEQCGLSYPVLTDMDNAFAMSLGLVVWIGAEIRALYESGNLDLAESQGNSSWMIPIPATYVIGQDGQIKSSFIEPDFRKRLEPEQILAAIHSTELA